MTGPGIGHPDWQAYAQWRGPLLVNQDIAVAANTTQTFGPFTVPNFGGLAVFLDAFFGGAVVHIDMSPDLNFVSDLQRTLFNIRSGNLADIVMDLPFPYVKVRVETIGLASEFDAHLAVAATNTVTPGLHWAGKGLPLSQLQKTIAPNTTDTINADDLYAGPATLFFEQTSATPSLTVSVVARKADGTDLLISARLRNPNGPQSVHLSLPPAPYKVTVQNTSGTLTQTYDMSLTPEQI